MLGDLGSNFNKFLTGLKEDKDFSQRLSAVLKEMEKGSEEDYKMKEGLITQAK